MRDEGLRGAGLRAGWIGCLALVAIAAGAVARPASADEMPERKAGLWEVRMGREGAKEPEMVSKQCIDAKTDKQMRDMGREHEKDCSIRETKRTSDGVTVHSVCAIGKSTATTDARFTGDFNSSYRAEIDVAYDPPLVGDMKTAKMKIEAKHLGDCGKLAPGDIEMPNGMKFNVATMGNPAAGVAPAAGARPRKSAAH